jgi:hypothetical protein
MPFTERAAAQRIGSGLMRGGPQRLTVRVDTGVRRSPAPFLPSVRGEYTLAAGPSDRSPLARVATLGGVDLSGFFIAFLTSIDS